ncbi:MAG: hypothetical protein GY863_20415 [bacterium]|nr:hypothetical protein [bacterium]
MTVFKQTYPVKFFLFASPNYWKNREEFEPVVEELLLAWGNTKSALNIEAEDIIIIDSEESLQQQLGQSTSDLAVFLPLSGGVQLWMLRLAEKYKYIALANAYLQESFFSKDLSSKLLEMNSHPACTDFYANSKMKGKEIFWVFSLNDLSQMISAWQAVMRLRNSRILQIGETEPWVINSCRDPERFREKTGTEIIEIPSDELYKYLKEQPSEEVEKIAAKWIEESSELIRVDKAEVLEASKVIAGIKELLEIHNADGLSLACFSMISDMGVSGCLTMSYLNDSEYAIGACEGDLDAAVSLFLVKALGEDFVWMGNPVIYENNVIDLTHCTSARACCGSTLNFKLMPHHESNKSVSINVDIPEQKLATLIRIGNDLNDIFISKGATAGYPGLQSCRTQVRVEVPSTKRIIDNLMGTHLILCLNDRFKELEYCAEFLDMNKRIIS